MSVERDATSSPLAGEVARVSAPEGGRAENVAPSSSRPPPPTPSPQGGGGWQPLAGQTRQKDFSRIASRAQRMRREATPSEARLWKMLRELNRGGAHFRRQAAVDNYVYDFGDYSARMLIELDGVVHRLESAALLDAKKDAHAARQGFRLLRLTNKDVWGRADWVMRQVRVFRADTEAQG